MVMFCSLGWMSAAAQDTLPDFSAAKRAKGRVILSWKNPFQDIRQLSIQRSDNKKGPFKTILTLPDPSIPENGFFDASAPHDSLYYRLYIMREGGNYMFSPVKRPVLDTTSRDEEISHFQQPSADPGNLPSKLPVSAGPAIVVKVGDIVAGMIPERSLKNFRDSILHKTKDTLYFLTKDTIQIKPFVPKEIYRPSTYVFTAKDGHVQLTLPENDEPYSVVFFDEADTTEVLFELKNIRKTTLTLDKSNFIRSGWFWFELYEGKKLKERHKLYIPKDF